MYKRLPMLALCLAAAVLGTSACSASGDSRSSSSASAAPSTASASAAPSESPSGTPAEARKLTGLLAAFYLKTIRENYPDLSHIDDDVLIAHGDAFCAARGQALADQAKKTSRELGLNPTQTVQIMGTAHGVCR
ncbi:hypothetical protein ABZ769_15510 [Streptomyces olivoreticuli]